MKHLTILLTVSSLLLAVKSGKKEFSIEVDTDRFNTVVEDLKDFGEEYFEHTESERQELMKVLANSWTNTGAKIILNFGKTVAPVVSEWAEIMKDVQVNDDCDQDCAVKCLDPRAKDTMFFNKDCLQSCKC